MPNYTKNQRGHTIRIPPCHTKLLKKNLRTPTLLLSQEKIALPVYLLLTSMNPKRVGVVGFGSLGSYLVNHILDHPQQFELVFVWNRNIEKVDADSRIPKSAILRNLDELSAESHAVDLIVEVSHPSITEKYAAKFLQMADYFVGSPTAFASENLDSLVKACQEKQEFPYGMFVPAGALWGVHDIKKMADIGTLRGLKVTMKKHPDSFRLSGEPQAALEAGKDVDGPVVLYDGPLRRLCPCAPSNVNTMACAALASGSQLGFDKVEALLVADKSLTAHVIEVEVIGPTNSSGDTFNVKTVRYNPAAQNAVTGSATYVSFVSSLEIAGGKGPGIHFC